jgi:hypothetical protein
MRYLKAAELQKPEKSVGVYLSKRGITIFSVASGNGACIIYLYMPNFLVVGHPPSPF